MKTEEIITYKRKPEKKAVALEIFRDKSLFPAIAAIMISRVTAFGSMAPLGLAWYAANICIDRYNFIFAASVLGSFLMTGHAGKTVHVASIVIMFALSKLVPEASKRKKAPMLRLQPHLYYSCQDLAGHCFPASFTIVLLHVLQSLLPPEVCA